MSALYPFIYIIAFGLRSQPFLPVGDRHAIGLLLSAADLLF
jgi:hypothetical protein